MANLKKIAVSVAAGSALIGSWVTYVAVNQVDLTACTRPDSTPSDGLDDRAAVQQAIQDAMSGPRCLDLSGGRWDVTRKDQIGVAAIPSLTARGPLRITGPGTLSMMGASVGDWVLLQVDGEDVTIEGIAFEGASRQATQEQTHLLQVRGPADRVTIRRSTFDLPGPYNGGDCIRLLGEVGARVRNVTIRDVQAPACYRSFLGIQRGVEHVLVERVQTTWVGDQAIDSEPTGGVAFGCSPIISDLTVRHSVLRRGVPRGIAITVAGQGCAVMDRVLIESTILPDGGIDILNVGTVTLRNLVLDSPGEVVAALGPVADDAQPTVLARGRIESLVIEDSIIRRSAHVKPQPAIQISALNGGSPSWAWLDGVTIEQADPRPAVRIEGLGALVIRRSTLRYTGAQSGAPWAVSGAAGTRAFDSVTFQGPWRGEAL